MRKVHRAVSVTVAVLSLCIVGAGSVMAAAGDADATFGGDGTTRISTPDGFDANAVVARGGKVVVAGNMVQDIAVARFEDDGDPDPTFGGGDGFATLDLGGGESVDNGLAVLSNGKIVVAGYSQDDITGQYSMFVARLTSAGLPDPNFGGGDGFFLSDFGAGGGISSNGPVAYDLVMLPNGRIIVAGGIYANGGNEGIGALWRFKSDGKLDKTFGGGDGMVTFETGPGINDVWRIAVRPDGKLIAAGWAETGTSEGDYDALVARFYSSGTIDRSFGQRGMVQYNVTRGSDDYVTGLGFSGNKIILAMQGETSSGDDVVLMRLKANGLRDRSWGGGDGEVSHDFGGSEGVDDLAMQPDGRIVVTGRLDGSGYQVAARFLASGAVDTGFGINGVAVGAEEGNSASLSIAPDGKILVVGTDEGEAVVTRFLP